MKFPRLNPTHRRRVLRLLRNPYFVVSVAAFAWLLFFDRFDVRSQLKMRGKIEQLREDAAYYRTAITHIRAESHRLESESEELERLAREQYLMKRPNEDVYMVVEE